jgi:integrase
LDDCPSGRRRTSSARRRSSTYWLPRAGSVPRQGLRGAVYETLFGLIASTGLRIGEALSLRNGDVDLKGGMLTIRRTKFGKSRQVPMHPSTVDALRRYRWLRVLAEGPAEQEGPFFIGTRGRRRGLPLSDRQVHRVFRDLRQQLGWGNRGAHHAPRIHDLRHNSESRIIPSTHFIRLEFEGNHEVKDACDSA